jgi:hypothetical protein
MKKSMKGRSFSLGSEGRKAFLMYKVIPNSEIKLQ